MVDDYEGTLQRVNRTIAIVSLISMEGRHSLAPVLVE